MPPKISTERGRAIIVARTQYHYSAFILRMTSSYNRRILIFFVVVLLVNIFYILVSMMSFIVTIFQEKRNKNRVKLELLQQSRSKVAAIYFPNGFFDFNTFPIRCFDDHPPILIRSACDFPTRLLRQDKFWQRLHYNGFRLFKVGRGSPRYVMET